MDELERAAEELEKATSELVRRADELVKRSEELNRQLLRLVEVLTKPYPTIKPEDVQKTPKLVDTPETAVPSQGLAILDEVKEFLDGPEGGAGLTEDPRD